MDYKQAFQADNRHHCGPMGRGWFGGPWGRGKFGSYGKRPWGRFGQPPVNVAESADEFVISLFAAGLVKENVSLTVKDDVLTISYPEPGENATPTGNFTHQEHSPRGFERQFQLNNKVLTDSISASYTDGILNVVLPKNPATNQPAQTITVG